MNRLLGLLVLAALALPATAAAQGPLPTNLGDAKVLGPVRIVDKSTAKVRVRYSCDSGIHLWVSAKQVADRSRDPRLKQEGSSGISAAWWQSHRGYYRCDGKRHKMWFYVDKIEPGSKGRLKRGWAWVQFCITEGDGPEAKLTVALGRLVRVVRK